MHDITPKQPTGLASKFVACTIFLNRTLQSTVLQTFLNLLACTANYKINTKANLYIANKTDLLSFGMVDVYGTSYFLITQMFV